ncbi:MAG: hypothetical protein QXT26_07155, partial [Thermoproteota archaeon]
HETGLTSNLKPGRYLWTDSFAVCNFLDLYRRKCNIRYLGRHREDDSRRGWISGLSEEEGWRHPTLGGLRIGKPLPERIR